MTTGRPAAERFPSLRVVTSRLNFERERQQETLLVANGYRFVDRPVDGPAPEPARPIPVVPRSASPPP